MKKKKTVRRNPVARSLRLLGKRIVPSKKIYSRKVLGSAPQAVC